MMSNLHHQKILPVLGNSILEFSFIIERFMGWKCTIRVYHPYTASAWWCSPSQSEVKKSRILLEKFTNLNVALVVLPYTEGFFFLLGQ